MSDPEFRIECDFEQDDREALNKYYIRTSNFARRYFRRRQILFFVGGIILLGVAIYATADGIESGTTLFLGVVAAALSAYYFLMTYPPYFRRRWLKQMRKQERADPVHQRYGRKTYDIQGDKFIGASETVKNEVLIKSLSVPVETDSHYFIFIDAQQAFVIPKRKIHHGDLQTFLREFNRVRAASIPDCGSQH